MTICKKISGLSRNFPGYPETFWTIRKISGLSGNFSGYPETFLTVCKKYPDYPETFQATRKLFGPSGKYSDYLKTFRTIQKFSKHSGNLQLQFQGLRAKTFRTRKNFPDGNAMMPRWFLGLCLVGESPPLSVSTCSARGSQDPTNCAAPSTTCLI